MERKGIDSSTDDALNRATDKMEIKTIMDAMKTRDEEIKNWCEKAATEVKAAGTVAGETKAALEKLSEGGAALQARLAALEQKMVRPSGDAETVKSLGEQLADSDDFKALAIKRRGVATMKIKAVTITSGPASAGALIQPERQPGITGPQERAFFVRSLIQPGRTASNAVEFVQETGFTNNAAPVEEGALKPQSDLKFELKTTTVKTVAHWFRASKQVLDDIPLLQSYIDGRATYGLKYAEEEQLLAGDGVGANLLGLIPQATAFNVALRKSGDTAIDVLRRAILQVRLAEYRPTAIVMHPTDWADIELQKDSTGKYIWVNITEGGVSRIWRLPVVDTTAMAEGHFMVGAFDMGAQVFDREDANVQVSTEDSDNFIKNMVTIRAEERLALAVMRPESFVYGAFA